MITIEQIAEVLIELSKSVDKQFDVLFNLNMNTVKTIKAMDGTFDLMFNTIDVIGSQLDKAVLIHDSFSQSIDSLTEVVSLIAINGGLNTFAIAGILLYLVFKKK